MRALIMMPMAMLLLSPVQAKYGGGGGTRNDPYLIHTADQMNEIGLHEEDWDRHFKLMADIDLAGCPGTAFNIIGYLRNGSDDKPFTGVFDGNDHAISGFCHVPTDQHAMPIGLFGYVEGPLAQIRNLRLIAPRADTGEASCVGPLVGLLQGGIITRCYVEAGTVSGRQNVGGLVGQNYGHLIDCSSSAAVHGAEWAWCVGGLAGRNWGTTIACHSTGAVTGNGNVGGLIGENRGSVSLCFSTSAVGGNESVGGLVGDNHCRGRVARCYSSGVVRGREDVGGLAGANSGTVSDCYVTCTVTGERRVGGLVGRNGYHTSSTLINERCKSGTILSSYSTSSVTGADAVGGLLGSNASGQISGCFWDSERSNQLTSAGGTSRTTAQMQTARTYIEAGWDFIGETENGTEDIWWILEGHDYPKLARSLSAFLPDPQDDAADAMPLQILAWGPGESAVYHDIYFDRDEKAVAEATAESLGVYRGRQPAQMITYCPGELEYGKTYFWRIDEVNEADPGGPWKGDVWSLTTVDFILVLVVDDFERYTDTCEGTSVWIWQAWVDGIENGTGSRVGYLESFDGTFGETAIVHGGWQSMPLFYDNAVSPYYSEAYQEFRSAQDWTINDADALTLYFRGEADNDPDPLYVAVEDDTGQIAVVTHPDVEAVTATEWQKWHIALADFQATGVDVSSVKRLYIGVGNRDNPQPGSAGLVFIDDIWVANRMP